jgi:hypothetical protein
VFQREIGSQPPLLPAVVSCASGEQALIGEYDIAIVKIQAHVEVGRKRGENFLVVFEICHERIAPGFRYAAVACEEVALIH